MIEYYLKLVMSFISSLFQANCIICKQPDKIHGSSSVRKKGSYFVFHHDCLAGVLKTPHKFSITAINQCSEILRELANDDDRKLIAINELEVCEVGYKLRKTFQTKFEIRNRKAKQEVIDLGPPINDGEA